MNIDKGVDKNIVTILQEVTKWKTEYNQPNHTYHLNIISKLVGYMIYGTKELIIFNVPKTFSKSYRKFIKIK